jgi:hypothetical protein
MFNALKTDLAAFAGISKDALHVHLGLFLFVAAVLVLRRSPGSLLPWLLVLALEFANEVVDTLHWHEGAWSFDLAESAKDLINTMLWPTLLALLARFSATWRKAPSSKPRT